MLSFGQRLTWWLLAALAPVMIGHGAFVYSRERALQVHDVTSELDVYAQIVQRAVEHTQHDRGWDEALKLGQVLEPRDLSFATDHRFLWLRRPPDGPELPDVSPELRALAEKSGDRLASLDAPDLRWRVYRLVHGSDGGVAMFEVSHDAHDVEAFIRSTALEETFTVLLVALACAVAVAVVNRVRVRPVLARLIAQAQRIDAEGSPVPVVRSQDEITVLDEEMSRMERRIAEARAALERESAAKVAMSSQLRHADRLATVGRLAAGVAHEFGTPLAVVRGRARLIQESREVPESDRASAATIVDQVDRMSRIIRQLLDLARRRGPPQGPCDLGSLLARVGDLLDHEASKARVELKVEPPEQPRHARGDLQQLEQVALNLTMNAIQALAPGGGGTVTLRCGLDPSPDVPADSDQGPGPRVWFEVEDDGPGVPDDVLPVVFEPFVTTKEAGQGTGLGLPLSLGIVRDHGGWITVSSGPHARFRVLLPPFGGADAAA